MDSIWQMNVWDLIKSGGPIMIPILFCSIISLGIFCEKMIYFTRIRINITLFKDQVYQLINKYEFKQSIELCDGSPSPVARLIREAVTHFHCGREELKEHLESVVLYEIPKMEKRLKALSTISHLTPLLGLLGTVTGMTMSFYTIQVRANSLNPVTPGDLAGGIGEALLTTVAGLMVAIPTVVAYNYCVSVVKSYYIELERSATELLKIFDHLKREKDEPVVRQSKEDISA